MMNANARQLAPVLITDGEEGPHMDRGSLRWEFEIWKDRMIKRYALAAIIFAALVLWTVGACTITAAVVRKKTTEEVTAQVTSDMRQGFQNYLNQQEWEQQQANFLTGDASFEAAVEGLAGPMAQVLSAYAQEFGIGEEGLNTIGWVFCARCAQNSTEFGKTPQEVLEKKSAWEGDVVGHAVRNRETEIAKAVAREYLNGQYPDGYTTAMTFLTREAGGKIIARNEFYTGPQTLYWWFGK